LDEKEENRDRGDETQGEINGILREERNLESEMQT
jgi:hypothetical protein